MNASRGENHKYLYADFPQYFTWDAQTRQWKDRKQKQMIGRLAFVGPTEGKCFYLCLLLSAVYSPKSFSDLLTVGEHTCLSFQEAAIHRGLVMYLNAEQKVAYKKIIHHVKRQQPGVFFIDGPGGTGKTYLYCALYARVRQLNKIILSTASSGIAAANLPNGRTAHSRFKLPIDLSATLTCDVPKKGSLAALLIKTDLIIWDEAPMANKLSIHSLDLLLRDLCSEDLPFGGKIVVFGGDFRQVLPVVPRQGQREAVLSSLVCSPLWPQFTKLHLTQNMRTRADPCYASFLLSLGDGRLQDNESEYIQIPTQILSEFEEELDAITELSTFIFPSLHDGSSPTIEFTNREILTPKNDDADRLNTIFINSFQGDFVTYRSFDTVIDDYCNIYPTEFLNTLCPGGMSPYELILKCDCPVILLRNMDPSSGLCNGTRLTCKRFYRNLIECEIAAGYHKGLRVLLSRIKLQL